MIDILSPMLAGLAISLLAATEAALCTSGTVVLEVNSADDIQNLTAALACTGGGTFDIVWHPSVTITRRIEVSNNKNVTVTGNGFPRLRGGLVDGNEADATIPAGSGSGSGSGSGMFSVSNGSTLRLNHLLLEGGNAETGGAVNVFSSSSLFAFGCTFENNNATNGGAISASTSAVYVAGNTSFEFNSAVNGGAIYLYGGSSMRTDGITFTNNHAEGAGGAVCLSESSTVQIDGSTAFRYNSAGGDGGAIGGSSHVSININGDTSFVSNKGLGSGGAVYAAGESSVVIHGHSTLFNNSAGEDGGAIYIYGNSSMRMDGSSSFAINTAGDDGGAMGAYSNASISINGDTSFVNNTCIDRGGALYGSTISSIGFAGDITFDTNVGGRDGGAVFLFGGTSMTIDGSSSFENNIAEDDGECAELPNNQCCLQAGAFYLSNEASMQLGGRTSFLNNVAAGDGGAGRAYINASVTFNGNVSFVNNRAEGHGGALHALTSSSFEFAGNSSFDSNFARRDGGAIYLYDDSSLQVNGNIHLVNNIANDDGGAIGSYLNGSIVINGNVFFIDNYCRETGGKDIRGMHNFNADTVTTLCKLGALYASQFSAVQLVGNSVFKNNVADIDGGAMYLYASSSVHTMGSTSFLNNMADDDGGAISATFLSVVNFAGDSLVFNNSAQDNGGGLYIVRDSSVNIDGNTVFHNNSARNSGGAMYVSESEIYTNGNTSVTYNSANSPGGGALFASQSGVNIDGFTSITYNSGYDGGAILAQESDIHVTGHATFSYNAANRDGGAIKTTDSSVIIATTTQHAEFASNNSLTQGSIETISFIGNTAFDYGGAVSIANPAQLNMSDVMFTLNKAESGGAVGLTSTEWATADFRRCRFEGNTGARGGAIYLNGKGQRIIKYSYFRLNIAEETGGALFNAGALEISSSAFVENMATDGGLAIQNVELTSNVVLWNVTFEGNRLECPSLTYSYTRQVSTANQDSCRFELACSECLDGCGSDFSNVTIDRETLPTCEPIPEGVWPSLTATTLSTLDLKEGYFRISAESPAVLDCYQKDACVGGIDPSHYCADGYSGPYCAVCARGYAPGANRRCHECSVENRGYAVGFSITTLLFSSILVLLLVSYLVQVVEDGGHQAQNQPRRWWQGNVSRCRNYIVKAMPLSTIRIVVVVMQIVVQFTEIAGAVYPDQYESFLSSMALVNFDIGSILSSSCLVSTDFYSRLVVTTVAPMAISLGCGVTFFISKMRNRDSNTAAPIVRHRHVSAVLFLVFFVYSSVSFTIFQTFVCDSLDDGKAYLRADYSITCDTERHKTYLVYASLMVCIYPIGIPAFFAFWLVRNRRELGKDGRETASGLKSYRCIWGAYKPSCYYYEVVECARRIVLTGAAVFLLPDTAEQIAIVLFFAVVFMFVSESLSPFNSASDMWLYRWGNGIILASMYVALLLKVDLAVDGTGSSSAITVLLIAAHVFMLFTVAAQAFLLMKEICTSKVKEEPNPLSHSRTQDDAFGSELEATISL